MAFLKNFISKINPIALAFHLVLFYALILIIAALSFITNIHALLNNSFILSTIVSVVFGGFLTDSKKTFLSNYNNFIDGFAFLFLLTTLLFISTIFWDNSYDGQTYHAQAIYELVNGWNPFKQALPIAVPNAIYIEHYPKAFEIFGAAAYQFTGDIETTKVSNFILAIATFLLVSQAIKSLIPKQTRFRNNLSALLIVLNPVVCMQLFSLMIDVQVALLITILVASFILYLSTNKYAVYIIIGGIISLISLKFTGLIYASVFCGLSCLYLIFRKYEKNYLLKFATLCSISVLIGFLMVSFNPYCTNLKSGKHLFYPLMGKGSYNIMVGTNAPPSFANKNRFVKCYESNFSTTRNVHGAITAPEPTLKIPFTFNLKEWTTFKSASILCGGFGPLFSGILLLSFIAIISLFFKDNLTNFSQFNFLLFSFLFSVFLIPECWLSRYVPQLWSIPLIVILYFSLQDNKSLFATIFTKLFYFVLTLNIAGIFFINISSNFFISQRMKQEYNWLQKSNTAVNIYTNEFISNNYRLAKYHIHFNQIKDTSSFNKINTYQFNPITTTSVLFIPNAIDSFAPSPLFKYLEKYVRQDDKK